MFGRKKNTGAEEVKKREVHDFILRSTELSFESYRTVDYRLYPQLSAEYMMPIIDAHLDKLLSGEVDDANGDMLDRLLFVPARIALPDLISQHVDHSDVLRRFIVRRNADRKDLKEILSQRQAELDDLNNEYENVCRKINEQGGAL